MVSILQSTIDSLQSNDAAEDKKRSMADYKDTAKKEKPSRGKVYEPERSKDKYRKVFETIMSSTTKISAALRRHT
jgi:hypothetical protein